MVSKTVTVITFWALAVVTAFGAEARPDSPVLRIYLPREIAIDGNVPKLGEIGILRGDSGLAKKAETIPLGLLSTAGQEVTINRGTVLSRLASHGIVGAEVELTGAEAVKVRRKGQVITVDELAALARSFIAKNSVSASLCRADLSGSPSDIVIEGHARDVKLVPRFLRSGSASLGRVRIGAFSGGKEIGSREVRFRFKYKSHQVVTLSDLPAGAVISRDNVKIEQVVSDYPEPADWRAPYGLVAQRRLSRNTVLVKGMVGPAELPVLVKRNQNVVIRIDAGGLVITATGMAVEQGRAGDYVKVRNVDSQRIIMAKVHEDGTVGPVF
ncbi:MAG: flagellar basal body P-ring formation protein FlgA [Sedimentisphaerales bacterium]|nr:flagellar basal body P-ring formation protein FlgA [Sedimentisphaerales bacterium]